MKSILPPVHAEHNYVFHRHANRNKHSILYLLLLISVITSLLAMPWIQFESSTTTPGLIAPHEEPLPVRVRATGRLNLLNLEENNFVVQGDTLFSIRRNETQSEEVYKAPIDGYVHNLRSKAGESLVHSGETILEIQPEASLVVKCYLNGDNVASVKPDQNVEFQVQSFQKDPEQAISGKITEILPAKFSKDRTTVYEVRCSIEDSDANDLRNSVLRPGMTLLARFRTARKSAFDILMKDPVDIDPDPS